jgi:hypothetical protein
MAVTFTQTLIEHITEEKPITFVKFGDGECYCMLFVKGRNCDRDTYTPKLGFGLIDALIYFSHQPTCYVGEWSNPQMINWYKSIVAPATIQFVDYHSLIMYNDENTEKAALIRAIHHSKQKKIIVCNDLLVKAKLLFKADELVFVDRRGWFDTQIDRVVEACQRAIGDCKNPIVMTMAGMGSKVLLRRLHALYKEGTFLDFGSAVDKICTKRETRGHKHSYPYLISLVSDILTEEWDDPKFEPIYETATHELGLHIRN